jgi:hypothetical protein
MSKTKGDSGSNPFMLGKLGGCEALLYEFRERFSPGRSESDPKDSSCLPEPHSLRIAATTFDEALLYLRRLDPDFAIDSAVCLGLITLVSGSPVD